MFISSNTKQLLNKFEIWAISGYLWWLYPTISDSLWLSLTISSYSAYLYIPLLNLGYLQLSLAILGYLGLSKAISGFLGLCSIIPAYIPLSWAVSGYLGQFQSIWIFPGFLLYCPLDCSWIVLEFSLNYHLTIPGLSLDYPLIFKRLSIGFSGLSWDFPFIITRLFLDYFQIFSVLSLDHP